MSVLEQTPTDTRPPVGGPPTGSGTDRTPARRALGLAAVLLAVATACGAFATWSWASTPQLEHFGGYGVRSTDVDLVEVTGPDTTTVVLPNDPTGDTRIMFDVVNRGPVPVTVEDVWPDDSVPPCFWHPRTREVRQAQGDLWHEGLPANPAVGAVIEPGEAASFWLVGSVDAPACRIEPLTMVDSIDVVVSALGRTSTVSIALPDLSIGLADDPAALADSYGVEVVPASD